MSFRFLYYPIILLLSCLSAFGSSPEVNLPVARQGLIDLRKQDFAEPISLNGEWHFYWKQLLTPGERPVRKSEMVSFPSTWNDYELNGEKLSPFGFATYQVKVLIPKGQRLRLVIPSLYCSYKLFINGKPAATNGTVSSTKEGYVPHWQYKGIDISPETDSLDLILQVANFSHNKGGVKDAPLIGKASEMILSRQRDMAIDFALVGCLFMGGLFFLGLYFFGNRDNAILYFALFSMVYSYRAGGADYYGLHTVLPDLSWYVAIRLEYLTLFLSLGLFNRYSYYLYPQVSNKKINDITTLICYIFTAAAIFLSPVYFTRLVLPFLFLAIFCLFNMQYIYFLAWKKKVPGAIYSVISSVTFMFVFLVLAMHFWMQTPPWHLLSLGAYICFFFLQSVILSHRVSYVLNTARREAEQGLVAKSDFLSTMSHEIRTPLNSVIGMSHLLLKSDPRADQEEKLEVMLFSANNLLSIVNDVLDYNKIEAGKITFEHIEMDVASIARNIVKGMQVSASDKGIKLQLDLDPDLKNKLLGDPTRVYQVMSNLVHNAIKFTRTGFVKVGIKIVSEKEKSITLRFAVKDTGIGISAEKQKLIFERFTQADSSTSRSFGGTGLGLSISKRILELQDSALQLESEEGKGSTFYFIQVFEKSTQSLDQKKVKGSLPGEDTKPLTGISILLVEDNALNVMVAQSFLQRWGATIDVAVNGQEALDKLDTSRHRLVLMDLHMPVMDGFVSTKRMRKNGVTIPIVALTADLPGDVKEELKDTGIDDIVVKPFLPDDLYRKVLHHVFKRN